MKKVLSLVLSLVMLLSVTIVPQVANADLVASDTVYSLSVGTIKHISADSTTNTTTYRVNVPSTGKFEIYANAVNKPSQDQSSSGLVSMNSTNGSYTISVYKPGDNDTAILKNSYDFNYSNGVPPYGTILGSAKDPLPYYPAGQYTVTVTCRKVNLDFSINVTPVKEDYPESYTLNNNTISAADVISNNNTVINGALVNDDPCDYYKINVGYYSNLSVGLRAEQGYGTMNSNPTTATFHSMNFSLCDANGNEISASSTSVIGDSSQTENTGLSILGGTSVKTNINNYVLKPGTYYISVSSWFGLFDPQYQLSLSQGCANHVLSETVTKQPSCASMGSKTISCSNCGYFATEQIPMTAHVFNETITKQASCTSTGIKNVNCVNCGYYTTEQIPMTNHTASNYVINATLVDNGSIISKCTACGAILSVASIYRPDSVALSQTTFTYDGNVKYPAVTVYDVNGNVISPDNYTVSYSTNSKVGKCALTVNFNGVYSGSISRNYTIIPKNTSIKSVTRKSKGFGITWKKLTTQTTGYEIRYSTKSNMSGSNKVVVKSNKTTSKTISKLKANKKYYVQIRTYKTVNGKKYYSSWSKAKLVKTK